ncbi:MAG TPA: hypothetical protein DCG85_01375 [Lachnospiraceae bacterium]|nr:hypothetical protein [Lachnospiraceae bacterium]
MEYVLFFATVFAILLIIMIFGVIEERRLEKLFARRMKSLFGKKIEKKRSVDYISFYADKKSSPDMITVNDLELDMVFDRIDYTASRIGEEILSKILTEPVYDTEELKKRNSHIDFFSDNEYDRIRLLVLMRKMDHNLKVPFFEVLDFIVGSEKKNMYPSVIADVLLVISLILAVFVNSVMFLPLIVICIYQAFVYYRIKKGVEIYLPSTSLIISLSNAFSSYKGFSKEFYEEFDEEFKEIKSISDSLSALGRFSFLAFNVSDGMDLAGIIMTYVNMIFHFDLIKLYSMFRLITEKKDEILRMYELIGFIEAWDSVSYFRASVDTWSRPDHFKHTDTSTTNASNPDIKIKDIYHPLIDDAVKNDISTNGKGVLFTGSNASGKSTFIKAVAINVLFSQTIATVLASEYKAPFFMVYTSMALRDDVTGGKSYFVVEVESVKRIFDAANDKVPLLILIDEVLRGTNTAERIGAAYAILNDLSDKNALVFTATHDLELTGLLSKKYDNKHFDEDGGDDDVSFSYKLKDGPATERNAIRLMKKAGFDLKIIEEAERTAKEYL